MTPINSTFVQIYKSHGIDAVLVGEWIEFPNRSLKCNAAIVQENEMPAYLSVQLDVRLVIGSGRTILESCGGFGSMRDQAIASAIENFNATSLHVLLAAFFSHANDYVTREEWIVGGRACRVTIGNVGIRGQPPVHGEQFHSWFKHFEQQLKAQNIGSGVHWVRLYFAQFHRKSSACEVLLDNEVWHEMQTSMAAFDWPLGEEFYSVRIFLTMQFDGADEVTPADAVNCLAEIVAAREQFDEDEVYTAMEQEGVPMALAHRAYQFTQVAWGRALLARLGVQFSPEFLCFDSEGAVVESGRLADEPCFATANLLALRYMGSPGFKQLTLMSADMHAVNNALHAGSKPENLVTGPAAVFLEAATETGIEKAQQTIHRHMESLVGQPRTDTANQAAKSRERTRPWWRFWG